MLWIAVVMVVLRCLAQGKMHQCHVKTYDFHQIRQTIFNAGAFGTLSH